MSTRPDSQAPTGVLLVNVGSPDAPTPRAVRRYLNEFLGDPKVVDMNPVLWWLIRTFIVLPRRGRTSAALYRTVWTPEGSPLVAETRTQVRLLAARLGEDFRVTLAMRHGSPSLDTGLAELVEAGCRRIVVFPMFPQYSKTTTGSVEGEVALRIAQLDADLELSVIAPYYEDPGYVIALATTVREHSAGVDHYVFSFHGLPLRYIEAGDPYRDHCEATAAALAQELGLASADWDLTYQSRFGREPWLLPDTAVEVPRLARPGRRVLVISPGFPADCLETLEELGQRLPRAFEEAGGAGLAVAPCLNDHPEWIAAMEGLVRAHLGAPGER